MVWWIWLLIYLGIVLFALLVTGSVAFGLYRRFKRVKGLIAEITASLPKIEAPGRS